MGSKKTSSARSGVIARHAALTGDPFTNAGMAGSADVTLASGMTTVAGAAFDTGCSIDDEFPWGRLRRLQKKG